jgi:hypothetical protein
VVTIPGHGYRFVATVHVLENPHLDEPVQLDQSIPRVLPDHTDPRASTTPAMDIVRSSRRPSRRSSRGRRRDDAAPSRGARFAASTHLAAHHV